METNKNRNKIELSNSNCYIDVFICYYRRSIYFRYVIDSVGLFFYDQLTYGYTIRASNVLPRQSILHLGILTIVGHLFINVISYEIYFAK